MKNLKFEFSEIENDLINKFIDSINGEPTRFTISRKENCLIKSESISAAIRVCFNPKFGRCIFVCIKKFENYFDEFCENPSQLKKALEI